MISLYYHMFTGGNWVPIAGEYAAAIEAARLPGSLTVGITGEPSARRYARQWWQRRCTDRELRFTEADEGFEQVTLAAIWRDAQGCAPGDMVCYAHAKGSYRPSTLNTAWRQSMTEHVITGWREATAHLATVDAAGCHWLTLAGMGVQTPMFAGNFWWANAGYLAALPAPDPAGPDRFAAERWIGRGWPQVAELRHGYPDGSLFTPEEMDRAGEFEILHWEAPDVKPEVRRPHPGAAAPQGDEIPLVTVITPTNPLGGKRHGLLIDRCIPSVQAQTYPRIEHIIVSDGPDDALSVLLKGAAALGKIRRGYIYDQLPPEQRGGRWGTAPRRRGLELATGEYITYLDDDDAYRSDHVAMLVGALQAHPEDGFAYSKMASHDAGGDPPGGSIIGGPELGACAVGSPMIMHRKEIIKIANWGAPDDMEDWRLVYAWLEAGVTACFVDWVTVDVWPSTYRGGW